MAKGRTPDASAEEEADDRRPDQADLTILKSLLGEPVPTAEAGMWAVMSTDRRAKAVQRMKALIRWADGDGDLTAAQAAADAGVSLNRFFEMAKAWRENRSLASLGTFAASSRRIDPRELALQRIVARVLGRFPTGSVRQMAIALGEEFERNGGEKVGQSMLRRVVEGELRRREVEASLGNEIQFDCAACSILRADDTPWTMFAVLDRGSQLLLGAALGDVRDSRAGYAAASEDALVRLDSRSFEDLPWTSRVTRMELVAGLDADRWSTLRADMSAAGVAAPVEPSTKPERFGRYLRFAIGDRLGLIDMWYGRTVPSDRAPKVADRSPRLAKMDAEAFLAAQVDQHNQNRLVYLERVKGSRPPQDVRRVLELLTAR